ncbi:2-succinyl-6-hydroxy-2,4-cyclohexadiene-1-carboxylate synthase [Pectobacterium sp. FL60-S17]|uniref:2-succinyl-6-hydroxy-2,4-cyclohexadiene-1-carboxylate synthase n=1 Tax=Pectobacterium quasiaquaticum TaxID=2774015 RepID=A0A9Q2EMX2_9GAMM|nr:2-succinyl-6-hydroxy-2,4-cyclohexadiene-1-carboxylate synthase [Pectobacterium quasiaquaticum]MBE5201579.1 2-succinyl-6-hydroxy-2,4-cyclohexadiene-1-carboxylate synthase [Pectobacterium quasiaquaticum]MBE5210772.1 2-succinyl-6-hydroxy-2,4-cyclohexadiene-1-carboxylate synthase [Pectobacterium quasiaquaticum]MBE5213724.1 2-succinyl-6-hydroxy-2,4-cyclohexadiene-1-carboxylate synthase [Pectobacterium quasiaquaticum]MBE5220693.1 2-succinyl-6-hydroxy-2,4-cyclohexadiene-1-carboxylate synthase [Pect
MGALDSQRLVFQRPSFQKLSCQKVTHGAVAPRQPWLVCLHGLLGSGEDWLPVLPFCRDWPVLLVDLPGHGASRTISTTGFADVSRQLSKTLLDQGIENYWLLGYSLGGRIAMYHACNGQHDGMLGLMVEGGHLGLATPELRTERIHHDARWAQRFRQEPLPAVLQDWYQQAVFADLDSAQREQLIARRSANHGASVAAMLEATSLGRQPFLAKRLRHLSIPFVYLCGASDVKFQTLAAQYGLPLLSVVQAGHNAHQANPTAYAERVRSFLLHHVKD